MTIVKKVCSHCNCINIINDNIVDTDTKPDYFGSETLEIREVSAFKCRKCGNVL